MILSPKRSLERFGDIFKRRNFDSVHGRLVVLCSITAKDRLLHNAFGKRAEYMKPWNISLSDMKRLWGNVKTLCKLLNISELFCAKG